MCGTRIAPETTAAKQNKVREQQSKPQTHAETNEAICIVALLYTNARALQLQADRGRKFK